MLKYEIIVEDLSDKISRGVYAAGDRLPTIDDLCVAYDVSRITVKRAMDALAARGLVARRRGSGTYVKGALDTVDPKHNEADIHVFSVVKPSSEIASLLRMDDDEFCYYLCRTCHEDGSPLVQYLFIPIKIASGLRRHHCEGHLIEAFEYELHLKIVSSHQAIGAVRPNAQEAIWLGATTSDALVSIREVVFLDDGRPAIHATSLFAPGYTYRSISSK